MVREPQGYQLDEIMEQRSQQPFYTLVAVGQTQRDQAAERDAARVMLV